MSNSNDSPPIGNISWPLLMGIVFIEALFAVVVIGGCWLIYGNRSSPADTEPIRNVLDAQVAAWNRGDLEGYMVGYWNSPELSFYSGGDVTKGWQPTLDRYRKRYQSEGKAMGHLTFSDVDIESLSQTQAFARGRWTLKMLDDKILTGLYTLLLKRIDGQWRIVHDHSSIATP